MTYLQFFFVVVWPFIALALVGVFARILFKRDMTAYFRSEAEKREVRLREAAE